MQIDLTAQEWDAVLTALQFASGVPGFRREYNPLPWVSDFERAFQKVEAALMPTYPISAQSVPLSKESPPDRDNY